MIRSFIKRLPLRKAAVTLERAEELYSNGRQADAASAFRELAEQSHVQAQWRLGQLYERGEGVLQIFVEAVQWFRRAAALDCVPAMTRLGEIYLTGLAAPGTATPAALLRLEKDPDQESLLKRLYPQGLAVAQDPEEAAAWNQRAARAGDAAAQARGWPGRGPRFWRGRTLVSGRCRATAHRGPAGTWHAPADRFRRP